MNEIFPTIYWTCSPCMMHMEDFVEERNTMIIMLISLDERYMPIDDKWTINLN